jgi:hypothetical protein
METIEKPKKVKEVKVKKPKKEEPPKLAIEYGLFVLSFN